MNSSSNLKHNDNRSVGLESCSDSGSSSPVSCCTEFGLLPWSPEELFEQSWTTPDISFDDFTDVSIFLNVKSVFPSTSTLLYFFGYKTEFFPSQTIQKI